jgi:poly-gamma-glutamate capsule biosynthesis protein CapA/YwtB (metallophosphatase superfamily)
VVPAAAQAATLPVGRPLTIAWAGDTTLGSSHGLAPDHGYSELRAVKPWLEAADLTAVNSEGTFSTGGNSKCGGADSDTCFAFRAPPSNASALHKAGVDIVNLANNHAFDFGQVGEQQTISALRHHDVAETGRPGEITVLKVSGARVAFVGFSAYPWTASITNLFAARELIRSARRRANVVVAFVHAGAEGADQTHTPVGTETFLGENRGDVRAFAHAAIDAGADLVVGSGPHVLRGMELYKDRVIAYSMGNLAGFHNFATGGNLSLSGIVRVTLNSDGSFLAGTFTSLALDGDGIPHRDPSGAAAALVDGVSRDDFGARALIVRSDGSLSLTTGS